jgi:hypothetical protein
VLIDGPTLPPDASALSMSLRRIRVTPGFVIPGHGAEGPRLLLVTDGDVAVKIRDGEAALLTDSGPKPGYSGSVVLEPGEGISTFSGAEITYRAAGSSPSTIVLVTFGLVDSDSASQGG